MNLQGMEGSIAKGKGMARKKDSRLICPDCASKVVWNGAQFVCGTCPWTEHVEKPPSSHRIELPKEIRDARPKD